MIKKLFKRTRTQNEGMKLPPHLQEIQNSTSFTAKEILNFQKKFINLCEQGSNKLKMEPFVKFMRMLGVKSNATLVGRIFNLMDADVAGEISFSEFMKYFDILLNGDQEQKAELIFLIIAIGNEQNIGRASSKMFFKHNDLYQLLKIMRESEMKSLGESPDREDLEALKAISYNMMSMLRVKRGERVTLDLFREAIKTDLNVLSQFQMIGEGLESLMSYQGENKYTRTVRALRLVRERFDNVIDTFADLNFGYGKYGIGNLIAKGFLMKANKKRRSQRFTTKTFMDKFSKNLKKSKFAKSKNLPTRKSLKEKGSRGRLMEREKENTINLQSLSNSPELRPKRISNNFSPTNQFEKFEANNENFKLSEVGTIHNLELSHQDSSCVGVDHYFKDEANIEFSQSDGIGKEKMKERMNVTKFKNDDIMTLEEVRRMVNEIEEGVYAPKNQIIKLYNDEAEMIKIKEQKSENGYNKKMPTFKKVKRVPNPNSNIFKNFEKFLGNNCQNNISTSHSRNSNDEESQRKFLEKVKMSEEYLSSKNNPI